jgi:hypothetical protein
MQNNKIKKLSDNIFQFNKKILKKTNWKEIQELKLLALKYAWCDEDIRSFLEKNNGMTLRKANFYSSSPTIEDINQSFEYDRDGASLPVFSSELYNISEQVQPLK